MMSMLATRESRVRFARMRRLVVIAWGCTTAWMAASDSGWTMSRTLAIGWDGKSLDGFLGPTGCRLDRTTLLDRVPAGTGDGGRWRAVRAGHERIACDDGSLGLTVAPAAVVVLDVPSVLAVDEIANANLRARRQQS
jgi:hypothetical protein